MLAGYLNAALGTDLDDKPLLTIARITNDSKAKAEHECDRFLMDNFNDLEGITSKGNDWGQVGQDLWLSRNGHGSGFFDRKEIYGEVEAKRLQDAAKKMGERHLSAWRGWCYID